MVILSTYTVKSAAIETYGQPLKIRENSEPDLGPDEVLVKLSATGVCHSDLHLVNGDWGGYKKIQVDSGVDIAGHEGVGKITRVGSLVDSDRIGERVGVPWINSVCGKCMPCLSGRESRCENKTVTSVSVNGTFAEYAKVSARYAVPIPDHLTDEEAAPLLCAGVTAYGACRRLVEENIVPGSKVAVIGAAGGLGHYAVQIARLFGYRVVAIDVSKEAIDSVRDLGAYRYYTSDDAEKSVLNELRGVSASLVFSPRISGYDLAARITGNLGVIVVAGMPPDEEGYIPLRPNQIIAKGLKITWWAVGTPVEFSELFELYASGGIKPKITTFNGMENINSALESLKNGQVHGRAVVMY